MLFVTFEKVSMDSLGDKIIRNGRYKIKVEDEPEEVVARVGGGQ